MGEVTGGGEMEIWSNTDFPYQCLLDFKRTTTFQAAIQAILQREALIRQRVTRVFKCDANNSPPIDEPRAYHTLITIFCAESATDDWAQ